MPAGDWASYFWPGTTVLRNKLGLHDRDDLRIQEHAFVSTRQADLEVGTVVVPATYDAVHLRAIHHHLFQDVYDWAGEYRTVPLAKDISEFAPTNRISSYLDGAAAMVDNTSWPSVPADEFARTMAKVCAWANHAHPFREGNGRATKIWLAAIAEQSPWQLDYERIDADVWNQASALSGPDRGQLTPDPGTLLPAFTVMTEPRPLARVSFSDRMSVIGQRLSEPPPAHTTEPPSQANRPQVDDIDEEDEPSAAPDQQRPRYRQ
jgi:cell filamentation protein